MQRFDHADTDALVAAASAEMEAELRAALDARGKASLMLSGGSSPKPVYERLAQADLPWDGVVVSLVDERWVPAGAPGSNADFIKACFAGTPAERAQFIPLYNGHDSAAAGIEAAEQALALAPQPFDIVVLGMGGDAHTASWFPNSGGLDAALDADNPATLCAVDATGCPVAGDHTDRITLTYSAVAKARHVMLLLPGAAKRDVFDASRDKPLNDAPVGVLSGLDTLSVHTLGPSA